jgi:hypothetical protein
VRVVVWNIANNDLAFPAVATLETRRFVWSTVGLLDEFSDASVHRSLSELSPVFDDPRYVQRDRS